MEINEAKAALTALQAKLSAYNHATALIYYDGVTTAPRGTAANRGQTLSILSEESYRLSTSSETLELLEFLDAHPDELDEREKRIVFLALKSVREMKKIPLEEYVAYQQLVVEAEDVWHTAKEKSDFAMFAPYLEKIFDTNRRFAGYCAPEKDPYDYWLDQYEDGLDRAQCDAFFSALRSRIVPLLQKIAAQPQVEDACLYGDFAEQAQHKFSLALMKLIGLDLDHCGLGTTEHPFTISLGSHHDVRITTNFKEDSFASSMYSVIHEGGHALYDMNSDDSMAYTLLDGGVSMGIHESQSRFYENLLGRSLAFVETVYPHMTEAFPQLSAYTPEQIWRAVNRVESSLIRTEADEVTYCLHVMVRYELEKRIMAGELAVADLPAEWNRLYREYLGVEVPNDREGVLQDSHWAGGMIGYFPSYALGSAYGAQLLAKMKETVDVDACLRAGDFAPINAWNREHIWQHGCLHKPDELLAAVLGGEFDPFYYIDYLERKFGEIYGI